MTKQHMDNEKLLFLYSCALEDGDFNAIAEILGQAAHDVDLMAQLREIDAVYEADLQLPRPKINTIPLVTSPRPPANGYVHPAPLAIPQPTLIYQTNKRGRNLMRIAILIITLLGSFFTYLGVYHSDSPVLVTEIPAGQSATMLPQAERIPITVDNADQLTTLATYGETHNDSGAVWSHDGSEILVYGTRGITIYNAEAYAEIETISFDGTINQLVVHPLKPQVAFMSDKNNLTIFDLATRKILAEVILIDEWVQELAYSPNGEYLVTAYWQHDQTFLWDSQTAEIRMILRNTNQEARGANFSPDSRYLAVYGRLIKYNLISSNDSDISFQEIVPGVVIWDVELGVQIGRMYGSLDMLTSLTYSADGNTLIGIDNRGYIYVWDVTEVLSERLAMNTSLSEGYHEASLLEDSLNDFWVTRYGYWLDENNMFITYNNLPSTQLEVWDIEKMELVSTTPLSLTTLQRWQRDFMPSPNEQFVALRVTDKLQVIDWQAETLVGEIQMSYVYWNNLDFSDDSSVVAVNSQDEIAVWDIQTGAELNRYEDNSEQGSSVNSMRFMPNSSNILLIGGNAFTGDGIVSWDIQTDETERITTTNFSRVLSLDLNSDNEMLFIDDDGNLRRLGQDIHNTEQNIGLVSDLYVFDDYFFDNPQALWLGSDSVVFKDYRKVIYVVDNRSGDILAGLLGHIDTITDITLSSDEQILASVDNAGTLILWDTTTWEPLAKIYEIGGLSSVTSVAVANNNHLIAVSGEGKVILWDSETQETIKILDDAGYAVEFSPDGTLLATIENNGVVLRGIPQ